MASWSRHAQIGLERAGEVGHTPTAGATWRPCATCGGDSLVVEGESCEICKWEARTGNVHQSRPHAPKGCNLHNWVDCEYCAEIESELVSAAVVAWEAAFNDPSLRGVQ